MTVSLSRSGNSNWQELPGQNDYFHVKNFARKICRITPGIVLAGVAGYYILGYAYVHGWMAEIDKFAIKAIPIISKKMLNRDIGYVAIGALMPTIQWYAAWAVRFTAASITLVCYNLIVRILIYSNKIFAPNSQSI